MSMHRPSRALLDHSLLTSMKIQDWELRWKTGQEVLPWCWRSRIKTRYANSYFIYIQHVTTCNNKCYIIPGQFKSSYFVKIAVDWNKLSWSLSLTLHCLCLLDETVKGVWSSGLWPMLWKAKDTPRAGKYVMDSLTVGKVEGKSGREKCNEVVRLWPQ